MLSHVRSNVAALPLFAAADMMYTLQGMADMLRLCG